MLRSVIQQLKKSSKLWTEVWIFTVAFSPMLTGFLKSPKGCKWIEFPNRLNRNSKDVFSGGHRLMDGNRWRRFSAKETVTDNVKNPYSSFSDAGFPIQKYSSLIKTGFNLSDFSREVTVAVHCSLGSKNVLIRMDGWSSFKPWLLTTICH